MPPERPAAVDPLVALADRCVQCGLCLPTCPTYRREGLETESPRGRIALARAWAEDAIEPTPSGELHLDHCLGCGACEAACPAGVNYGGLLVAARAQQRQRRPAPWRQRVIERLAAHPRVLSSVLGVYRRVYPALPARLRWLSRPPRPASRSVDTARPPPPGPQVALFIGCVARAYEPAAREALLRLCSAVGVHAHAPPLQGCCGAVHAHAGNAKGSEALAARNASAFAGATTVLTLASGCHAALEAALPPGTRAVDAIEFIAREGPKLHFRRLDERIALHLPCTQRHGTRSVAALRQLLARVPGLEIVELDAGLGCCGAAGTQMLTDAARAADFRAPLLQQVQTSGARRVLSANLGCRLHLGAGTPVPVQHPLELLAEALQTPAPHNTDRVECPDESA